MNTVPNAAANGEQISNGHEGDAPPPCSRTASPCCKPASPKPHGEGEQPQGGRKHWLDYATGMFAFLAALGGITAAVLTGWQGWVARDTEHRELRAYVGVTKAAIESMVAGHPSVLSVAVRNFGVTPAYSVGIKAVETILPRRADNTYSLRPYRQVPLGSFNTLFPKITEYAIVGSSRHSMPLTERDIRNLASGRDVLLFYGSIYYRDAFKGAHRTDFCYSFVEKPSSVIMSVECRNHHGTASTSG
jgi:type II secretory pathway pseudopilin PulG